MTIVSSLFYEMFIRCYRYFPFFRFLYSLFFPTKTPRNIFFIIGAYNSGTTIIKNVVVSHPSISSMPIEGDLLTSELTNMEEGGWNRCLYGNKDQVEKYRETVKINSGQLLKDWSPWISTDKYFLEKSIANSVRVAQLRKAFPDCKFINIIRSPDGVNRGIKKRSQPTKDARKVLNSDTYSDSILNCQWSYIYNLIKTDSQPNDTYNCCYESFIENPESSTRSLFRFLGLNAITINLDQEILQIGSKEIYIRPLPADTVISNYEDSNVFSNEIERLKCD